MIYDCFPFFNELMLLEIRLNELTPHVDKFVIVEAIHTYSGKPKRLYYDEVKDNAIFAPFKDKIIHIVYDGEPATDPESQPQRRDYEIRQKNAIKRGLVDAKMDDIIIVSDLDEIVNPKVFGFIKNMEVPCRLAMKLYYYYFNCRVNGNKDWIYAAFCRLRDYRTAHFLRHAKPGYHRNIIINAGWHFSDLMPPDKIVEKLGSFCHTEYDSDYFKDADRIKKRIAANADIYERPDMTFSTEPLDAPEYVMKNTDRYKEFIKCSN